MASSQATSFPVAPDQEQNRALVVVTSSCRKLVLVMGMMLWALESPWRPAESKGSLRPTTLRIVPGLVGAEACLATDLKTQSLSLTLGCCPP
ncbi:uncharacterized protein ACOB7L_003347 isoform 2-T2 [Callospermophilus lateralis]|uniref:uncharacterized protein LOC143638346 isoform X2 n=1 Tax=Callospermophilus lateralis TaxID=76772 RepID=UPI00405453DC